MLIIFCLFSQASKASVTKHKGKNEKTNTEATTHACNDDIVQVKK